MKEQRSVILVTGRSNMIDHDKRTESCFICDATGASVKYEVELPDGSYKPVCNMCKLLRTVNQVKPDLDFV